MLYDDPPRRFRPYPPAGRENARPGKSILFDLTDEPEQ
jgi:hypothetical protein